MEEQRLCRICQKPIPRNIFRYGRRKLCGSSECQRQNIADLTRQADRQRRAVIREQDQQEGKEMISCAVCGQHFEIIQASHLKLHNLKMADYKRLYPKAPLMSDSLKKTRGKGAVTQSRYLTYEGKAIDEEFQNFFAGVLLGDGSLEKQPSKRNARYAEGGNNSAYLSWKYEFIRQYLPCSFTEKLSSPHTKTGKQYQGWWIKTTVHPDLTEIHKLWYTDRKILPYLYLERYLNEFALALWFCDDGHSSRNGSRSFLYPLAFSLSEVEYLFVILHSKFKLPNKIILNKKNQPLICFNRESTQRLKEIVSQFKLPGMEYKYL